MTLDFDILNGDCFELIKDISDNSIDLVVTSPPYADILSYGKNISIKKPNEYVDWILPLFKEIHRVLKPSGSFILNINDNCKNGLRNIFVYELIYRNSISTPLKLYDTYIWHKKNGIPNGGKKRFRNMTEFIFHFVKDQKQMKFHMDRVMEEPAEATKDRAKHSWSITNHGETKEGQRTNKKYMSDYKPTTIRPDNVFRFHTASKSRDNHIKHPAPFYVELPSYFINLLTDEGDVVLDPFSGIGTTGLGCDGRKYIGMELNTEYADFSIQRLGGVELREKVVCQYDLDDNLIQCFKNRTEASKATGVNEIDIMRTYNRNKFDSRGGYKWKLQDKEIWEKEKEERNLSQLTFSFKEER